MAKKKKTFRYGELFSGPGGLALGALRSRLEHGKHVYEIEHEWASDYDEDSCRTYIRNLCPDRPDSVVCEDVRTLDLSALGEIDAFAYGFPCNDFSVVGEQKGFEGEFGPLYTYGVKVLGIYKPKFFVAENVGGMASADDGRVLKKILVDLSEAGNGYTITPHLYKAELYGVPQSRHRIIIVGIDKTLGKKFEVPAPTTPDKPVTAKEAFEKPPITGGAPNHEKGRQSKTVTERLKRIKPGENAWTADLPEHLQLNVKNAKLSQIYKRLEPDKPSYTITGSGGGGTHGYHYNEPRALTNRERARIQSFPDDFVFEGGSGSIRKQIGMAVPPKLSEIIFTSVLKTLAGVTYNSVEPNAKLNHQLTLIDDE